MLVCMIVWGCARARVFADADLLISLQCLFVYRCIPWTHEHTQQSRATHTLTQAMKARQKCRVAGLTNCCCTNKDTCIEEKQRVRQPAARYTQQNKQKKNKYIHTHTQVCMLVCMIVWGATANQSSATSCQVYSEKQTNKHAYFVCLCLCVCMTERERMISTCAHARACAGTVSLISLLCLFVCRCTPWHKKHSLTQGNTINTDTYISRNDGKSTLSLKHSISVLSHVRVTSCHVYSEKQRARSNQRHTRHHRSSRVCEWSPKKTGKYK